MFRIVLLLLLISTQIQAIQEAIVVSPKAVIYSDIYLKSPIGYVRKGKKLAVGEVKRRRGTVLPVAINGQLGWIKTQDVLLEDEQKSFDEGPRITEHDIEDAYKTDSDFDPLTENNYLTLRTGTFGASDESLLPITVTGTEDYSAKMMSVYFEHRHPLKSHSYGFGIDYYSLESEYVSYQIPIIKAQYNYAPFRLGIVNLELFGSILASADAKVKVKDLGSASGTLFGIEYGALARFLPHNKIGATAGFSIISASVKNANEIENLQNNNSVNFEKFAGTSVWLAAHYRF